MLSLLRVILGALFAGHGTQKLFGWFGGHGPEGTGQFLESLGLRPGSRNATIAGTAEAAGGAVLATGLATPLAAAALSGSMFSAIRHVHLDKGLWVSEGGYEYNLVILAALAAITAEENGTGRALAALAAGAAGSAIVSELARREAGGAPRIAGAGGEATAAGAARETSAPGPAVEPSTA